MMEMVNAQAQNELTYMRRLVEDLNFRLAEAVEISKNDRLRASKLEKASLMAAEDWKAVLESMDEQYQAEKLELQKVNADLKLQLIAVTNARDEAMRLTREARLDHEMVAKRSESLLIELRIAKEALTKETRKSDEALEKHKADLRDAYQVSASVVTQNEVELRKQVAASFQAKQQAELLRWELFESRQKEMKLCAMENELGILQQQLTVAKEAERLQAKHVNNVEDKLQEAYLQIHQMKIAEAEVAILLNLARVETEENRQKWKMACKDVDTWGQNCQVLQSELENLQEKLWTLQDRESSAWVEVTKLEAKLLEAMENLASAIAREQSKDGTLNNLRYLLEAAKLESKMLRQQIYEVAFEAHIEAQEAMLKTEADVKEEVLAIQKLLEFAQYIAMEARNDLKKALVELQLARELAAAGCLGKPTGINQANAKDCFKSIKADNNLLEEHSTLKEALVASRAAATNVALNLEVTKEQLDMARAEAEIANMAASCVNGNKTNYAKQEKQLGVSSAKEEIPAEKEQGRHASDGALVATDRLKQLEDCMTAVDASGEIYCKTQELSELWEIVESGCSVTIKQDEYGSSSLKLCDIDQCNALMEMEITSLKHLNQMLSAQLDAANTEMKDLRRLLQAGVAGEGEHFLKPWEIGHEVVASRFKGPWLGSLEEKIQLESLKHSIYSDVSLSEEESMESLPLSSRRKKKKALFLRVLTYLSKRMN